MRTLYTNQNIHFTIETITFLSLNIVFETFYKPIPKHTHGNNCYEIHYIPYGQGKVVLNDTLYNVIPNTLYVTGPHVEHAQYPDSKDPMSEYCIYLKIKHHAKLDTSSYLSLFEQTPIWFGQDTQDIHLLMQQIFYELEHRYIGYMTQVETLLSQCIVKLIRNYKYRQESKKHFPQSNLMDSKQLIVEESFLYDYDQLTLETLSYRLGLSTRQCERFLKSCYGKTFIQKKIEAKMSAATIKLSHSSLSITAIALELGYSSVEHFSHAFKKYFGITPSFYRKK